MGAGALEAPTKKLRDYPVFDVGKLKPAAQRKLVSLAEDEGAILLADLLDHATQSCFTHAHRWRPGDLVMWDNRCTLHRAVANYAMNRYRRIMHRNVVKGGVPV